MTKLEQDALTCLHMRSYNPLDTMALDLVDELGWARRSRPEIVVEAAETYYVVLEELLAKGWVKVVREPRAMRLERLLEAGWLTPPLDELPERGDLDFTSLGWRLYRNARGLKDCLVWLDEDEQTFNCVAGSKKACHTWFKERCTPRGGGILGDRTTHPAQPTVISEPMRVGKWLKREQQRHPAGWKLTIHYRKLRRRRVQIPELGLDAWLEPREHVRIDGYLPAGHVCFWLGVSQNPQGQYLYKPVVVLDHRGEELVWSGPSNLPAPITPEQAIAYLTDGIQALRLSGKYRTDDQT